MFSWNSLNPWGPGFDNVLFMILLAFVLAPLAWVAIRVGYAWRAKHPRPELPKLMQTRNRPWDRDAGGWQ